MEILAIASVGLLIFLIFMKIVLPKLIYKGENKIKNKIGEKRNAKNSEVSHRLADRYSEFSNYSDKNTSLSELNKNDLQNEVHKAEKAPVKKLSLEDLDSLSNTSEKPPLLNTDEIQIYSTPTGSSGNCCHCKKVTDEIYSITIIKDDKVQSIFVCEDCCEKLKKYVNKINSK